MKWEIQLYIKELAPWEQLLRCGEKLSLSSLTKLCVHCLKPIPNFMKFRLESVETEHEDRHLNRWRNSLRDIPVMFSLFCTTHKENIKTKVSTSELPNDRVWCVVGETMWNSANPRNCGLYCVCRQRRFCCFLWRENTVLESLLFSADFTRLQEYLCLDKWWCHYKLRRGKSLKIVSVLLCWML